MPPRNDIVVERWSDERQHEGRVFAAVFPHSDDLSIFASGTALKLIHEGYTGYLIKITDDDKDSWGLSAAETSYRIDLEMRSVTEYLGLSGMYCLGYENHYLEPSRLTELRHRLILLFRFLRVDTVISYDPWGHYEENPDHYLTAQAVEAACWMAGRRLDLPESVDMGLHPKSVPERYYVARGPQLINRVVDIAPVIERKRAAIALHTTPVDNMWRSYRQQHPGVAVSLDQFIDSLAYPTSAGEYEVRYGEAFHYIDSRMGS
jgi:LmbE family N-acetylglucosaminyl deacetylase